jgi:2-phosphosulfolactate phosphatase
VPGRRTRSGRLHGVQVTTIGRCDLVALDDVADDEPIVAEVVVVFDVIRAFTTACAAFDAGATAIRCVAGLDEARALATRHRGSFLMGEEHGRRPEGFDAGNSPADLVGHDLTGRTIVQRTTNGTRGLARFADAPVLLAGAAVNAPATAAWIRDHAPAAHVLLVGTSLLPEDDACARFVAQLVDGGAPDPAALAAAVLATGDAHTEGWSRARPDDAAAFAADLAACSAVGTSTHVLRGRAHDDGSVVLTRA